VRLLRVFPVNAVLPEDISNSLAIAGIPELNLGPLAKGEVRFLSILKSSAVRSFVQKRARLAGLLWYVAGHAFEDFAEANLFRGAAREVQIGDHVLDFLWKGRMIELKTGRSLVGRELEQLAEFAAHSKSTGYTLMYMFLRKPEAATINKILKAGGTVVYFYE
jgi:hypothetical protein